MSRDYCSFHTVECCTFAWVRLRFDTEEDAKRICAGEPTQLADGETYQAVDGARMVRRGCIVMLSGNYRLTTFDR